MTGLISVADDAEKRAKNIHQKMKELSIEIDTMSDAVSKLKGFASEGIRNVTDDGKLDYYTFEKFFFIRNLKENVISEIAKSFLNSSRTFKIFLLTLYFCSILICEN